MKLTLNAFRFGGDDLRVAFEVFGVKCERIFDFVRFHRGNDLCVVNLNAGNGMFRDEFAPVFINFCRVGKKFEKPLQSF